MIKVLKIACIIIAAAALSGADTQRIHPSIRTELRRFAQDMTDQMATNEQHEWGFDRLQEEYRQLAYEFANTNNKETISYLTVRVANAAMMLRHYGDKIK